MFRLQRASELWYATRWYISQAQMIGYMDEQPRRQLGRLE